MIDISIARKASGAPLLRKQDISNITQQLLEDYDPSLLEKPQPVDIEKIICDDIGAFYDNDHMLSPGGAILGLTSFMDGLLEVYDEWTKSEKAIEP